MRYLAIVTVLLLAVVPVAAQRRGSSCGPGGCGGGCPGGVCPLEPSFAPSQTAVQEWTPIRGTDEEVALMRGSVQLGAYSFTREIYRPYLGSNRWAEPCAPPMVPPTVPVKLQKVKKVGCGNPNCLCESGKCPCQTGTDCPNDCPQEAKPKLNFGMDFRPDGTGLKYYRGGEEVERTDVVGALKETAETIGDKKLPDDSAQPWLVVIGTPAETAPVVADLRGNERLKTVLAGYRLKVSAADGWWVSRRKLDTTGHPTIYKLAADGKYDPAKDVWKEYRGPDWFADELNRRTPPAPIIVPDSPNSAGDYTPHVACALGGAVLTGVFMLFGKKGGAS